MRFFSTLSKKYLILRCLAKRGLEGRTTAMQPISSHARKRASRATDEALQPPVQSQGQDLDPRFRRASGKVGYSFAAKWALEDPLFSPLPAGRGERARVRGAEGRICGAAHLTFPGRCRAWAPPSPPEGRRGAFPRNPSRRILRFRLSWRRCCNRIRFPGQPCAKAGVTRKIRGGDRACVRGPGFARAVNSLLVGIST